MLLLGLTLSMTFVSVLHFIVAPLLDRLYEKYEPLVWHWSFKLRKRLEKVKEKLG